MAFEVDTSLYSALSLTNWGAELSPIWAISKRFTGEHEKMAGIY